MIKESELDDDQIKILTAVLDKSCVVAGCAGSGKSVLALIKAQRIQKEKGDNYKIIVFTKALCGYMNSGREELGLHNQFLYHWYWKNRLGCSHADYMIVDEIQDFEEDEIQEFIDATNKHFFFFGDTAQSIYDGLKNTMSVEDIGYILPKEGKPKYFELYRNYRLPVGVARLVQYVGVDLAPFDESTYKSKSLAVPRILRYDNQKAQISAIGKILKRNPALTDCAILVPHNEMVKTVGTLLDELDVNYEMQYNDKENFRNNRFTLNFTSSNLKIMTYHSAKGLQFEAVFLPFIEEAITFSTSNRKSLYVAMTRTYKDLYIMYSGYLPELLSNIPKDLYETTEIDSEFKEI